MQDVTRRKALEELARRQARKSFLAFMNYIWWMPGKFQIGRHTRAICGRLTKAVEDLKQGKSTYLMIDVPFRHGKSDMVSRAFPAFFLGACADIQPDVIVSGCSDSLAQSFTLVTKRIIESDEYKQLFHGVKLSKDVNSVTRWQIEGSAGLVTVAGINGSIMGKGGRLVIVDDYFRTAEEANSKTYRDKTWEAFTANLITRAADPCIFIVCATRWHTDDIGGRIIEKMKADAEFPRFERLSFPARKEGEYEYLFPERYSEHWYKTRRSALGSRMAAALLDCEPIGDKMRWFKDDWLVYYNRTPKLNVFIIIDSANAKKKDSDYTTMIVIGRAEDGTFYVLDMVHDRMNLGERTEKLLELHRMWRPIRVFWEQLGAMSDVDHVKLEMDNIGYHFKIDQFSQSVAKPDRIRWIEPQFEKGNIILPVRILRLCADGEMRDHIREFLEDEYQVYPSVKHDDMLDCLANIMHPDIHPCLYPPKSDNNARSRPATAKRSYSNFKEQ